MLHDDVIATVAAPLGLLQTSQAQEFDWLRFHKLEYLGIFSWSHILRFSARYFSAAAPSQPHVLANNASRKIHRACT